MTSNHLSTLVLHQLRYGELDGTALASAKEHLSACARCASRLGVQQRERSAFVLRPMPEAIRQIATPAMKRPFWQELLPLFGALAASAALSLAVPQLRESPEAPARDVVATRGEMPLIEAWVDRGEGPRPLRDGEALSAGDRVQLAYDPSGAPKLAIAGRDGEGLIEVYTTDAPTGTGFVRAPFALTLDASPGVQELFVLGSPRALDDMHVRAAITSGVPGVRVARLAIEKEIPR